MANSPRMRRSVVAVGFAALVLFGSSAAAHDHRPPRATVRVGSEVQRGLQYHADGWSTRDEDPRFCEVSFASGYPTFRKPALHTVGEEIVVRFHKKAMPLEIEAYRWPRVDERGQAAGTSTPLPWTLRPHHVNGEVAAWEVVIIPPAVQGHLYLGVGAYWADEDGCSAGVDLGSQYAAWTFHVKGR